LVSGCGSKKGKVETPGEGDTDTSADVEAAGIEPEANTGPVDYPTPPKNNGQRNPVKFELSVKKAYVLPLSKDGACFDDCPTEIKELYVQNLPNMAGEQFGSAAAAMTTTVGAKGGSETLPDVYVHIDCGFGQEFTTHKTSAENQLAARWRGASETIKMDPSDQCAVSVWDADDDNQDELIGDTTANLIQLASNGSVVLTSEDQDFGQVYMVELFLEQMEGEPVMSQPGTGGGTAGGGTTTSPGTGGGGSTTPAPTPPPASGAATYKVEIIKANIKEKKKDGQKWDAKIPFVGKEEDTAPDPMVKAYINGYQSEKPFMTTQAGANTLYHEWKTSADANLKPGDKLYFMVWDKDKLDHDLIGECITDPVGSLSSGQDIVLKGCGQVDFIVVKVTRK
jgi:hypothetical protein